MGSLFDYINWRGDLSLEQSPFNPVDNIILTHLPYLPLDNIIPGPIPEAGRDNQDLLSIGDVAVIFTGFFQNRVPQKEGRTLNAIFKEDPALLEAVGNSRRYRDMKLAGFVNQIDLVQEKQFAALTILMGDNRALITYRGTDDSLVGWKEDFNMAFNEVIPAQTEAVQYLETMAQRFKMPLVIGGHSKGGNLGIFAASFCSKKTQKRIEEIYVNDAPGFNDKVINSEEYQAIKNKIRSYIPEGSVIGMLFEHGNNHTVVKSSKTGLLQHDIYTWEVMGNDLIRLEGVSKESRFIVSTIKEWITSLDKKQRQDFIEALFAILNSTEAKSFPELGYDWLKSSIAMIQSFTSLDDHSRDMLGKTLKVFFRAARNNIPTLLPLKIPRRRKGAL